MILSVIKFVARILFDDVYFFLKKKKLIVRFLQSKYKSEKKHFSIIHSIFFFLMSFNQTLS